MPKKETKVRDSCRVHHKTVTEVDRHRRKRSRTPAKQSRVTARRVDPRIWETAKKLSQGNPRRIEVISTEGWGEVIIHNNPVR